MVQLYYGFGKGKTSAAAGAAVRAAGNGMRVIFAQFFKDGKSGEIKVLRDIPGITRCSCRKATTSCLRI